MNVITMNINYISDQCWNFHSMFVMNEYVPNTDYSLDYNMKLFHCYSIIVICGVCLTLFLGLFGFIGGVYITSYFLNNYDSLSGVGLSIIFWLLYIIILFETVYISKMSISFRKYAVKSIESLENGETI